MDETCGESCFGFEFLYQRLAPIVRNTHQDVRVNETVSGSALIASMFGNRTTSFFKEIYLPWMTLSLELEKPQDNRVIGDSPRVPNFTKVVVFSNACSFGRG